MMGRFLLHITGKNLNPGGNQGKKGDGYILHFNDNIIDRIKEIPVEQILFRYAGGVTLRNNSAKCPVHSSGKEKHPSFRIYPKTNSFHCWGCHKGGSGIDLVMLLLNCSFGDAIKIICLDFGIPLNDATPEERRQARVKSFKLKAERELRQAFEARENDAYRQLSRLYRSADRVCCNVRSPEELEEIGGLFHVRETLEQMLETLRIGTDDEKRQVLKGVEYGKLVNL